jgi:beta-lactam-binding protein with PASTA domain
VISESPAAGTLVSTGSAVNLVISSGQVAPPRRLRFRYPAIIRRTWRLHSLAAPRGQSR